MATDNSSTGQKPSIGQKARQKLAAVETEAKTAALSAVNSEKNWFRSNWKAIAVGFVLGLLAAYLVHKL